MHTCTDAPPTGSLLTEKDAARYIAMSVFALRQWRCTGRGPAFFKLSRSVRYTLADLDNWLARHRVPTYDAR
jgi:hypothetical protein